MAPVSHEHDSLFWFDLKKQSVDILGYGDRHVFHIMNRESTSSLEALFEDWNFWFCVIC